MRRARLNRIAAPIGASQLVGPSSQRVGLVFLLSGANTYAISTEPLATLGDGAYINNTANSLELTIEKHGEIVQMPWFAWAVNAMTINVLEVLA